MPTRPHRSPALASALVAAMITAGCSHAPASAPYAPIPDGRILAQTTGASPASSSSLVYLADFGTGYAQIYNESGSNQPPIGQIGVGSQSSAGLWTDKSQNIYIAVTSKAEVLAYKRGAKSPFRTYTDPNLPFGVCGDNKGDVYAADSQKGNQFINTIEFYLHGATKPTETVTDANAGIMAFCAVDSKGNLFVDYFGVAGGGGVDEFPYGSTTPTVLLAIGSPGGLAFDKHDDLIVVDRKAQTISTYAPPYTKGTLGSFSYAGVAGDIQGIALDKSEKNLWGADDSNAMGREFAYPSGSLIDSTSNVKLVAPTGVALSPAAKP